MTKRTTRAASVKPVADGFQNDVARLGMGADNMLSQSSYQLNPITRQRVTLDYMYRGSWIAGAAVDAKADDMTQAGIDFASGVEPKDGEVLHGAFDRLGIWNELGDGVRWGRLYGGAIVVMLIDGQDLSTPLRPDTVGKGQFKGLLALDRWQLQPSIGEIVSELGPHFGKPKFYTVICDETLVSSNGGAGVSPMIGKKIHYSRVFRFDGHRLPFYQRISEQGWGLSVIERLYDRLVAFDSATLGTAQLAYKAHLRTLKVEGLTKIIAAGGPGYAALVKRVESIRRFQSSEGFTVIDAADDMTNFNQTFTGLDAVILQFAEQISGAIDTPLVRLLGQSPSGFNSGDSDLRTYYDGTKREQEKKLKVPVTTVLDILHRSELGRPMDDGVSFVFNPLWQMSDKEKAEIAVAVSGAVSQVAGEGLIDAATALKDLRKSSQVTGVFSNITDADIEAAENEPPKPSEIAPDPEGEKSAVDPLDAVRQIAAQ